MRQTLTALTFWRWPGRTKRHTWTAGVKASVYRLALILCVTSSPAFAQGSYIGASLTGDVLRVSESQTAGVPGISGSGEALGFALRIGTPLGSMWGVEADFSRPAVIETELPGVLPLGPSFSLPSILRGPAFDFIDIANPSILTSFSYSARTQRRNTTLSAGVWARQDLSSRFSMVYLGGVGFHRTEVETELMFQVVRAPIPGFPIPGFPTPVPTTVVTKTTSYGARPFVGIEARIAMTGQLQFVPGIRLHGLDNAWLVRPSVGLAWTF